MHMKQLSNRLSTPPPPKKKLNAAEIDFKDVIIFPSVIGGGGPSES